MISINQLTVRFGGFVLFENISFLINDKERIGLVGRNGIGKSTLMKILNSQQSYDEGSIAIPQGSTAGYLPQHLAFNDRFTVLEEALQAFTEVNRLDEELQRLTGDIASRTDYLSEDYAKQTDKMADINHHLRILGGDKRMALCEQALKGLGFKESDFSRLTSEFSGGWRMRIELAKLLLQKPSLLMLDEPTNHLDIEAIEWLEAFLDDYPGAVFIISHDRRFLDSLTNRTIEIANKKIYDYPASYSRYAELLEERLETQRAAYSNQQKKIKDTQEFIDRFRYKATKASQVQSRIKALNRMDLVEVETFDRSKMNLRFPPAPRSGEITLEGENISVSYDRLNVLENVGLIIERGEKIAFAGRNGEGKTTMVKIILGQKSFTGKLKTGHNVKIGYFAQNQTDLLNPNLTVFQTIDNIAVGEIRTKVRDILGAFLFSGEDIDKPVKVLSGGEKARLAFACMLLEPVNLLILDEPTHHLDMVSKNILKQALVKFDGSVIIVSHDRDFLTGLTTKTYEFRDKKIIEHLGGIQVFLDKRKIERIQDLNINAVPENRKISTATEGNNKELYNKRKYLDREIRKAQTKEEQLQQAIDKTENEINAIQDILTNPENVENKSVFKRYDEAKYELEILTAQWLEAAENVEKLKNERSEFL